MESDLEAMVLRTMD